METDAEYERMQDPYYNPSAVKPDVGPPPDPNPGHQIPTPADYIDPMDRSQWELPTQPDDPNPGHQVPIPADYISPMDPSQWEIPTPPADPNPGMVMTDQEFTAQESARAARAQAPPTPTYGMDAGGGWTAPPQAPSGSGGLPGGVPTPTPSAAPAAIPQSAPVQNMMPEDATELMPTATGGSVGARRIGGYSPFGGGF